MLLLPSLLPAAACLQRPLATASKLQSLENGNVGCESMERCLPSRCYPSIFMLQLGRRALLAATTGPALLLLRPPPLLARLPQQLRPMSGLTSLVERLDAVPAPIEKYMWLRQLYEASPSDYYRWERAGWVRVRVRGPARRRGGRIVPALRAQGQGSGRPVGSGPLCTGSSRQRVRT